MDEYRPPMAIGSSAAPRVREPTVGWIPDKSSRLSVEFAPAKACVSGQPD
jgi:hypothetical protein